MKAMKTNVLGVLLLILAGLLLLAFFYPQWQQHTQTHMLGKDLPVVQTNSRVDNVGDVQTVARTADEFQWQTSTTQPEMPKQLSTVTITVSGTVYAHLRSGAENALAGALVKISGVDGATAYSDSKGSYSVSVNAYSDGSRVYLSVYCSKSGFHTADAVTWVPLGGTGTIPGLQTTGNTVTVNFVLYEETAMVYCTIKGKVVNPQGQPVQGAVVTVYPNFELAYTFTDINGLFSFNYAVCFGASEQPPTSATVTVKVYKQNVGSASVTKTVSLGSSNNIPTVDVGTITLQG